MAARELESLHSFPDRAIREALRHPDNLRELVEDAAPDLTPGLDFARAEALDREFLLEDWRRRESDLLFRVPYRRQGADAPVLVCVLIEHQTAPDVRMPLRLLVYAVLYWERLWKEWEDRPPPRGPLRLSPVVPIVFHTGTSPWGPERHLADLVDAPAEFAEFVTRWRTLFWDLAEWPPEALLAMAGPFLKALAVVRAERSDAATFREVFAAAARQLEELHDRDRMRWYDLLRLVLSWGLFRRPAAEKDDLVAAARASQQNAADRREVESMSETLWQTWPQKVAEEGRARGLAEGRASGLAEGQLLNSRKTLRRQLERRFGPLPEALVRRIESCTDAAVLEAGLDQVVEVGSLEEFRLGGEDIASAASDPAPA
jgi:hypothetical protein